MFIKKALRWAVLTSWERRRCEMLALHIAMMYEEADEGWVQGIISRAYSVASGDRKPHHVLEEFGARVCEVGFKPPFGPPEEMIP